VASSAAGAQAQQLIGLATGHRQQGTTSDLRDS